MFIPVYRQLSLINFIALERHEPELVGRPVFILLKQLFGAGSLRPCQFSFFPGWNGSDIPQELIGGLDPSGSESPSEGS